MLKNSIALLCLFSASAATAQMNSSDLKWGPAPGVFPKGAQMAVLSGNPGTSGTFTVRLKMPAGYAIAAHSHPTDELVTVISGDLSLGMCDRLDRAKSAMLHAGGFANAPAKMNHYAFTTSGAVVQIIAEGPFAITYVNPADDPTGRH